MTKLINWKQIYKQKPIFHIYFTARKRGKSDTKGWSFLEAIVKDNNYRFAWIRRRWHDSLLSTKPFFEDLVHKFCEENPHLNPNHFEIRERGLSYQGTKRIDFYDLFSYQRARGAIARTTYLIKKSSLKRLFRLIKNSFMSVGELNSECLKT